MIFDQEKANEIKGKTILVGVTYLKQDGSVDYQQQLHGIIRDADVSEGIMIDLAGAYEGQQWNMPPDTSSISSAAPGIYSLRSTGESIENPDYLCTWEVHRQKENQQG